MTNLPPRFVPEFFPNLVQDVHFSFRWEPLLFTLRYLTDPFPSTFLLRFFVLLRSQYKDPTGSSGRPPRFGKERFFCRATIAPIFQGVLVHSLFPRGVLASPLSPLFLWPRDTRCVIPSFCFFIGYFSGGRTPKWSIFHPFSKVTGVCPSSCLSSILFLK